MSAAAKSPPKAAASADPPRTAASAPQTAASTKTAATERPSSAQAKPNPKAYDRLPNVLESFPPIFSELETEQRDRRQLDQTRIDDAYTVADALQASVVKEENARLDADLSLEKVYQQGIIAMYKSIREPMRDDFADKQRQVDAANHRLQLAMAQLKQNVVEAEVERANMKSEVIAGVANIERLLEECVQVRKSQLNDRLSCVFNDDLRELREVVAVEKQGRQLAFVPMRQRCDKLEQGASQNDVAALQIQEEIKKLQETIRQNRSDRAQQFNVVVHTITEYCAALQRGLVVVNASEPAAEREGDDIEFIDRDGKADE